MCYWSTGWLLPAEGPVARTRREAAHPGPVRLPERPERTARWEKREDRELLAHEGFSMIKLSRWVNAMTLSGCVAFVMPLAAPASDGGIVALAPRPNEYLSQSPKVVSVSVAGKSTLARSAVRLVLDGRDVSDAISTNGNLVEYKPAQPLSVGEHAVEVAVTDAAGGKLSYSWTFTVEGAPAQAAQRSPASSAADAAPAASPSAAADADDASASSSAASAPQTILGQQNFYGGFYPIGAAPYYWGDNAQFEFNGIPGGYGFLTFSGIPGVFDLLPLGLNTFYAIVPIPIGFVFGPPFVTCHFFTPGGHQTVVVLPSFPVIHHRRVVTEPVARVPGVGRTTTFRSGISPDAQRQQHAPTIERTAPGTRMVPHFVVAHPVHAVTTQPSAAHPIIHIAPPPHVTVAPVPAHLTTMPVTVHPTTTTRHR